MPTALLPAIPPRPADRPETFAEYQERREAIALHRRFADDLFGWLDRNPLPDFDPFAFFERMHCGGYAVVPAPRWMNLTLREVGSTGPFSFVGDGESTRFDPPPGFKAWDD